MNNFNLNDATAIKVMGKFVDDRIQHFSFKRCLRKCFEFSIDFRSLSCLMNESVNLKAENAS